MSRSFVMKIEYDITWGSVQCWGQYDIWDDDIDILMPRPDYLRFVKVFNKSNDRYEVKSIEIDEAYWNTFAKVFDLQTYMEEPRITVPEKYRCINIDIFPLDGMPKGNLRKKIHLKFQEFLITLYRGSNFNYTVSRKCRLKR